MLEKSERLKGHYLFNLVFKIGKTRNQKFHSKLLSLYYLFQKKDINRLNKNTISPKVAFIAGLSVDKKAVKRNLIKRRMKAAYKTFKKPFVQNNKNISVIVFVANPPSKDATFLQIKDSIKYLLAKLQNV